MILFLTDGTATEGLGSLDKGNLSDGEYHTLLIKEEKKLLD